MSLPCGLEIFQKQGIYKLSKTKITKKCEFSCKQMNLSRHRISFIGLATKFTPMLVIKSWLKSDCLDESNILVLTCAVTTLHMSCMYVELFAHRLEFNHYAIAHAYNAANTHAQGSDRVRWNQSFSLIEDNQTNKLTLICWDFWSFYQQLASKGGGELL